MSRLGGPAAAFAAVVAPALTMADCRPDCNADGKLNINDFICFQSEWKRRTAYGDYDSSGAFTVNDFIRFQADFAATVAAGGCGSTAPTDRQLAGEALPEFPHFEFVRSFNAGSIVRLAVDPSRDPSVVGKSADVYILADRTEAQWASDSTLADVRGAPQRVEFSGSDTRSLTFGITKSEGLASGSAGEIALGYDLVIDANRNGKLDGGDWIDGRSDGPGFCIVRDLTASGGLGVTTIPSVEVTWPGLGIYFDEERIYYPSDVALRGVLPLVVIAHGVGHQYTWYDYLGEHLASFGFIVVAHHSTAPLGADSSANSTLYHTDAFLDQVSTIAPELAGHVDASRIAFVGHSMGGEGVTRACAKLVEGRYVPTHYVPESLLLVTAIAPTDSLGSPSRTYDVPYAILYGSADGDVTGAPDFDIGDSFNLFERAAGDRHVTYVHGADHNDFNCCGVDDFTGPPGTAIGRPEAEQVAKAAILALVEWFVEGDIAAKDYLWRPAARLRAPGISPGTTMVREYRETTAARRVVIDDCQSEPGTDRSSSGGAVTFDVENLSEGRMRDGDGSLAWSASAPMNGMSRARATDDARCSVLDWPAGGDRSYALAMTGPGVDFASFDYLSLRACQQSRHPLTRAKDEPLEFTVTVRDGSGRSSSVSIAACGFGLVEPYARTGYGSGAGWQNAFDVVRVRTDDFGRDDADVDLRDVRWVVLEFGAGKGAPEGRIALDDVELIEE